MGIRGVWSLENVENKYPQDDWVPIPNVFVNQMATKPNAGWLGGGYYKKLAKISFDTDSKTQYGYNWEWSSPTTFYGGGNRAAGTAGVSHGYFSGGSNGPGWPSPNYTSYMTKLVYATGVPLTSPSNTISANRSFHVGVSADDHGYLLGGSTYPSALGYDSTSDTKLSIVDKITNATDTAARIPAADLPSAQTKKAMSASAANPSFAYMSGGITPIVSTAARFTYSTETVTQTPSANNLTARSYHSASSNGSTNFYWHGGGTTNKTVANASPANNYMTKSTEKTVIATDTTSAIPAEGDTVYCSRGTTGNSLAAYSFGGGTPYGITYQSDKMTYSNETKAATPSLNLQASYGWSDISPVKGLSTSGPTGSIERWFDNTVVYGGDTGIYLGCGYGGGTWTGTGVDKMDFTTETMSESTTSPTALGATSAGSSGTKGYFFGGRSDGSARSTIWKYTYSSDSLTLSAEPYLGGPSYSTYGAAFDSEDATYYGGYGPGQYDGRKVYKLDYSDDSSALIPALSPGSGAAYGAKQGMSTVSNIGDGIAILAAGTYLTPTPRSYTFKVNYSSETIARVPGADYPFAAQGHTSIGSPNAGYFAYGYPFGPSVYPAASALYKYDYSSDTFSTPGANMLGWGPIPDNVYPWMPGSQMAYSNDKRGVTGNSTNAYWVGGVGSGNATYMGSNIDKLTYATEVISTLPGGDSGWNPSTPAPYKYLRYYGHGATSVRQSNRKIVPPVVTPTATKGPPYELAYKGGGYEYPNPAPGYYTSSISKFDMQTDVYTTSVATMPGRRWLSASSSLTAGYFAGGGEGDWGPYVTTISKIVYSTETSTVVPGQIQNSYTGRSQATGNNTAMYYIGGLSSNKINKMPYSTEVCAHLTNMPFNRYEGAAWSNQTQGYAAGGHPSDASSSANKIVYSSDTLSTTPGTKLYEGIKNQQAASNATNGYIFGGALPGSSYKSTTSKWVMSNDTVSRVPAANMPFSIAMGSAGGSPTVAACFGGANQPSPSPIGITEKLTYATDTWTNLGFQPDAWNKKGFSQTATASATNSGNPGSGPVLI